MIFFVYEIYGWPLRIQHSIQCITLKTADYIPALTVKMSLEMNQPFAGQAVSCESEPEALMGAVQP